MPAPRTKKASTSVQQSLKSTWTNSTKKTASLGEKKSTVKKPNAVVMAVPIAPKRTIKEKRSATDESSAEESEIESYSSSESDNNDVKSVEEVEEVEETPIPVARKKKSNKQLSKVVEVTDSNVHSKDETEYTKVLRKFDLSYEFGPCVGVSRLERWKRAEALGLEPPVKVRDILLSKEGEEHGDNIFHGRV